MVNVFYFSQTEFVGIQENFLREGCNLYVCYSDDPNQLEDITGLSYKYPKQLIICNGFMGDIEEYVKQADLVYIEPFTDSDRAYRIRRMVEKVNSSVVNGNHPSILKLETDRLLGRGYAESHLPISEIPRKRLYCTQQEALDRIDKEGVVVKRFLEKNDKPGTYIPTCMEDYREFIKHDFLEMFKDGGVIEEPFIDGYEVGIGGWFDGEKFCQDTILIDQEYKGALPDTEGNILTGQSGTCGICVKKNELNKQILDIAEGMENILRELSKYFEFPYKGFFSGNFMFTNDAKIYFLEFTARPGLPTEIEMANYVTSFTDVLSCCTGDIKTTSYDLFDIDNYYIHGSLINWGSDSIVPQHIYSNFNPTVVGVEELDNEPNVIFGYYDQDLNIRSNFVAQVIHIHVKDVNFQKAIRKYEEETDKVKCFSCYIRKDIGEDFRFFYDTLFR